MKISQLPPISRSLACADLVEISADSENNAYTSSKATLQNIADFVIFHNETQFGSVSGSLFQGCPKVYQVVLPFSYVDTSYTITVTGEDLRVWSVGEKTSSSFLISANSNVSLNGFVYWRVDK